MYDHLTPMYYDLISGRKVGECLCFFRRPWLEHPRGLPSEAQAADGRNASASRTSQRVSFECHPQEKLLHYGCDFLGQKQWRNEHSGIAR